MNEQERMEMVKDFCEKHGLREHFIEQDLLRFINAAYKQGSDDREAMIIRQNLLETKIGGEIDAKTNEKHSSMGNADRGGQLLNVVKGNFLPNP